MIVTLVRIMNAILLSISFLNSVTGENKIDIDCDEFVIKLKSISASMLASELDTDFKRLAFWLNIYNANVQLILRKYPVMFNKRSSFFSSKQIWIAGELISLDVIEHGILRLFKNKYSLGYFNKFFPTSFEKQFRLNTLDYRIHFALNCGARSCPAITSYYPEHINEQLNHATSQYLVNEVIYDEVLNRVELPALFLWFRNDFGGSVGILNILKYHSLIPHHQNPAFRYSKYDWSLYLNNIK